MSWQAQCKSVCKKLRSINISLSLSAAAKDIQIQMNNQTIVIADMQTYFEFFLIWGVLQHAMAGKRY
jgi:hypothetical protein